MGHDRASGDLYLDTYSALLRDFEDHPELLTRAALDRIVAAGSRLLARGEEEIALASDLLAVREEFAAALPAPYGRDMLAEAASARAGLALWAREKRAALDLVRGVHGVVAAAVEADEEWWEDRG